MNKKWLSLIWLSVLLIAGYIPSSSAHNAPFPGGYDPTHLVIDSVSEPETLDPAWCSDTASAAIIFNVYETVVFFDTVYTDGPYNAGKTDAFKPQLATDVAILSGPTPYAKTFYFKIRGADTDCTFETTGVEDAVDLFKDGQIYGQIYGGRYFVRDPEYGVANKASGPMRPSHEEPSVDGLVDRASVPSQAFNGQIWNIIDTTWIRLDGPTWTSGCVIRSIVDVNDNGVLDAGDRFGVVRKCNNPTVGPWWNVREYWTVQSVDPGPPFRVTASPVPVLFHNGAVLTPEDVEYSWERWMVQDRDGGQGWMWYYPILYTFRADDPYTDPYFGDRINNAIGSNSTHAWIHLENDFPIALFLQILCQSCASIVNKGWCVAMGDFDGNWAAGWETIYGTWHDPAVSYIEDQMMGTGPFKLDYWTHGTAWSIIKYDDYWDGWPANVSPTGIGRLPGFFERITEYLYPSWTVRRPRFLAGDADFTAVPRRYRDQILGQMVGGERIRCYYPLDTLNLDAFFFNFDINPLSPYLGPGFDPADPYVIAEDRIRIDMFSDINVRLFFAYEFNYLYYLATAFLGEGTQPADPVINGLIYNRAASLEDETWEKHNELPPANGVFDAGESIYFDADNSFTVSAPDTLIEGPILSVGTPLISFGITLPNDEKHAENIAQDGWFNPGESIYRDLDHDGTVSAAGDIVLCGASPSIGTVLKVTEKFADANDDDEWGVGEPAIRDNNANGVYDADDTLLAGTPLKIPDDYERFADVNNSNEWEEDEPAIRDNNANGVYDPGETVLVGSAPPKNTALKTPDDNEMYADINNNDEWDVGEPAIRDNDYNSVYSSVDTVLAGEPPALGAALKTPDDYEKFAETIDANFVWDVDEPAINDTNNDGFYDIDDTVLAGEPPAPGAPLQVSLEKFADTNDNDEWDINEPVIRDNNCNGVYDPDEDTVVTGTPPSTEPTYLKVPNDYEKFADVIINNEWDNGEPAIRDNNNDNVYGDALIQGPPQPVGTGLVSFVGKWKYVYNPSLAIPYLALAWGGDIWANGMSFTLLYNYGNVLAETAATMLANNINGLNPLFHLTTQGVAWYTYLPQRAAGMIPVFMGGWTADFTHPHDFVHPFMHSQGIFASWQGYSNPTVDDLIEWGIDPANPNPAVTYATLQEIYFTDVPSVPLVQPVGRHWEQAWMRGWYYNPLYGGSLTPGADSTATEPSAIYFYHLWKAVTHFGDANNDGAVDVLDSATVSASWTKPKPISALGRLGYRPQADMNGGTGATTGSNSGIVVGIPDGKVDTLDSALVSAYWDSMPQGPSHP